MAAKFGERKLLQFANLVLREAKSLDEASRTAYGKPFATVDKACLSWIRDRGLTIRASARVIGDESVVVDRQVGG